MDLNKKITWHLAGAFSKFTELKKFFGEKDLFDRYGNIVVYDGIEVCKWNAGRLNRKVAYDEKIRDHYYGLGWNINLTFTNANIDVTDETGNFLLEKMHHEGNGIILINEDLRRYVQKNFPKYKLIHSITGCGKAQYPMTDDTYDFYKGIQDRYDTLIPRCDNNFDPRLKELDISRMEILVSDTCIMNCKHWHDHFQAYSDYNSKGISATAKGLKNIEECWIPKAELTKRVALERKAFKDNYPFDLNASQIKRLILDGFCNFKIQGRESSSEEYLGDLGRFLLDYNQPLEKQSKVKI